MLEYLRTQGEPFEALYHDAAVPLGELYEDFLVQGRSPAYFDRIPRVQDVAAERGILQIERRQEPAAARIRTLLREQPQACMLVRTTTAFTRGQLHARGWRADHFVRAAARGEGVLVCNDVPPVTLALPADGFDEAYDGEYIRVTPLRRMGTDDRRWLWQHRRYLGGRTHGVLGIREQLQAVPDLGIRLRDLAGVYRTLRQRMRAYYGAYVDTAFLGEALPRIDGLYARLEYGNLRGREAAWFCDQWEELAAMDQAITETLAERLEATTCSDDA